MKVNFFSFHIGDFLGGTMGFDAQELGSYTSLLIAHYQAGNTGLQDDEVLLARYARVSLKVWRRIRHRVLEKFSLNDGHWTHERVIEELRKMHELSSQNSEKSLKRWNTPKPKAKPGVSNPISTNLLYAGKVIRLRQESFDKLHSQTNMNDQEFAIWLDREDAYLAGLPKPDQAKWYFMIEAKIKKMNAV